VITEMTQDIQRSVRFIRHNAAKYGINPEHIGVTGGSSGGHLALLLAVQGGPGDAEAEDPVDRESSAVQAVACFFPPTDFLNYGKAGVDAVGVGALAKFKSAFGPRSDTAEGRRELGYEISPINFIRSNLPPTLIVHGDSDTVVPIQQSETFVGRAKSVGAMATLVVKHGAGHGWPDLGNDVPTLADWFDKYLRGLPVKSDFGR
jgi:acetyl esterase/lipase